MTAKEYLNQIRRNRLHQKILLEKIEELNTQAQGLKAITYDKDRIQVSPSNKLEEYMVRITVLAEKYARNVLRYEALENKIRGQIQAMPNDAQMEVLMLRYVETDENGRQMTFERIACILHKSFDWVCHLHGYALKEFERRYL